MGSHQKGDWCKNHNRYYSSWCQVCSKEYNDEKDEKDMIQREKEKEIEAYSVIYIYIYMYIYYSGLMSGLRKKKRKNI